jgi:iron complex outermembrane receptor protein
MSTAHVWRTAVAVALAGVLAFLSSVTRAQVSNAPATTAQNTQTAGTGDQLQEVVVTAQFRAETAQETPISITAVTGEQLAQQGAQNIIDVAEQTPNVTMRQASTGSGRSNQAFIRGIGQGDFLLAYSPRVAFYVDDVYFSTVFGSIFDLMDVDHVEVLRGP